MKNQVLTYVALSFLLFLCQISKSQVRVEKCFNSSEFQIISSEGVVIDFQSGFQFSSLSEADRLELIKELMILKGDSRIHCNSIRSFTSCPHCSVSYFGRLNECSIQIVALHLINRLFYKDESGSLWPVLSTKWSGKEVAIKGALVNKAFKKYERWMEKVVEIGLDRSLEKKVFPLKWTNLKWGYKPIPH